jgi:hypothetical protein
MRKNRLRLCGLVLASSGLSLPACSPVAHDCHETRSCPQPIGYIDAGNFGDWWDAGATGEDAQPSGPDAAGGAPASNGTTASRRATRANGAAQAGEAGEGGSSPVDSALTVLTVSPADGASGVSGDVEILLRFSCAIDAGAFEAAYRSADLPAAQLSFSWDETHTAVTLKPKSTLPYAAGALAGGAVPFPAKTYHYGFADLGCDTPGGPLTSQSFGFSTLREVSAELSADALYTGNWTNGEDEGTHNCLRNAKAPYKPSVCIGDDTNNVRYVGFVSFDLSDISAGIVQFSSARLLANATLYGSPGALGPSLLEHVSFAALGEAALEAPASANLGAFYVDTSLANGQSFGLNEDITSAVAADYAKRSASSSLSQFRLSFAKIIADSSWDDIELATSDIRLSTTYLVP